MKVGVLCEFSGTVRDAFIRHGHVAVSCDLLPTESPGPHWQGDCLSFDWSGFDLLICHPPCTYLTVSGNRWRLAPGRAEKQAKAVARRRQLWELPVARIAIENPIGVLSSNFRKPNQVVHPWQHGHNEVKATCLWLKGLPDLEPSIVTDGRAPIVHRMAPGKDRWKKRSVTYEGIARAMAQQWGTLKKG